MDAYAAERELQVVGVYYASERLADAALSPVAARIGEKLQQRCCAQSAVFIVRPSSPPRMAHRQGAFACCWLPVELVDAGTASLYA